EEALARYGKNAVAALDPELVDEDAAASALGHGEALPLPSREGQGVGASASEVCYAGGMRRIDKRLTQNARNLRNNSTKAERLLGLRLRQYRPRFTRQLVIDPNIVDLACREARLAIELDGGQHVEATTVYDTKRTAFRKPGLGCDSTLEQRSR